MTLIQLLNHHDPVHVTSLLCFAFAFAFGLLLALVDSFPLGLRAFPCERSLRPLGHLLS